MWQCSGYLMEVREDQDVQERHGYKHSRKIYRRESAEVVFTERLMIGVSRKVSLPNAPVGTGESNSKSKTACRILSK